MVRDILIQLYERDLRKIIEEINSYKSDEELWILPAGIPNSGGNLALHLIGNINHFFGANLGQTGYRRDRELEFSNKNLSRVEITEKMENTISVLKRTLELLSEDDLNKDYPEDLGGSRQNTLAVIIYMLSHLNYHLGQINYHRRFISV